MASKVRSGLQNTWLTYPVSYSSFHSLRLDFSHAAIHLCAIFFHYWHRHLPTSLASDFVILPPTSGRSYRSIHPSTSHPSPTSTFFTRLHFLTHLPSPTFLNPSPYSTGLVVDAANWVHPVELVAPEVASNPFQDLPPLLRPPARPRLTCAVRITQWGRALRLPGPHFHATQPRESKNADGQNCRFSVSLPTFMSSDFCENVMCSS